MYAYLSVYLFKIRLKRQATPAQRRKTQGPLMPALPPHMRPEELRPDVPVSAAEDPSRCFKLCDLGRSYSQNI